MRPGLLERLLAKLVPHFDIVGGCESSPGDRGDVYLRRFFVKKGGRQVLVHHFLKGDADRELHDHPWGFASLILSGGYWEVTETGREWIGPGRLLLRPAAWRHRVELPLDREAWTLVVTGPKERTWFFWDGPKPTPWRQFIAAKCAGRQP